MLISNIGIRIFQIVTLFLQISTFKKNQKTTNPVDSSLSSLVSTELTELKQTRLKTELRTLLRTESTNFWFSERSNEYIATFLVFVWKFICLENPSQITQNLKSETNVKNMKQTENFHYQQEIAQRTVFKWETVQESVQDRMKQDSYSKYF